MEADRLRWWQHHDVTRPNLSWSTIIQALTIKHKQWHDDHIEESLEREINWEICHRQIESMAASALAQQAGHAEAEAELLQRLKSAQAAAASSEVSEGSLRVTPFCPTSISMQLLSPALYLPPDCLSAGFLLVACVMQRHLQSLPRQLASCSLTKVAHI